ncbi:NnrU family protein [Peteryoungia desertarenae]|uniref:NnrU family protein n=1 Tax=Peteryoungia desertarenae TaxID=1813451 RepID=A0ABX6QIC0_9HYPH|nr:NnrU family protein [Peteryoungia desertarenae]QLF68270.1 NnrU family protein [Peteryoungia desertarenae]
MTLLIVGIILFLATHMVRVVAPGFRNQMIVRFGEGGWKGIYSGLSAVTLAILVWGYAVAPTVNIWFPPTWTGHLTTTIMIFAMICLVAAFLPAGHIAVKTKHPMVLSVKIWAFAHLIANGDVASVLLFVAFLAWGVILRINLKRRQAAGDAKLRPFVSAKHDVMAVVIGLVAWAAITMWLHKIVIGVAPIVVN